MYLCYCMATIGIFDSGIGGLSVLREVRKLLPSEDYIYFSDNAYCPYGQKDPSLIIDRAREISDFLLFKGADVIVVACNTATGAAIATLRAEYSSPDERVEFISQGRRDHVKFVGMEPAIKPAAKSVGNRGTRPVMRNSRQTGIKRITAMSRNRAAIRLKNGRGR